jgi:hypothetical protein
MNVVSCSSHEVLASRYSPPLPHTLPKLSSWLNKKRSRFHKSLYACPFYLPLLHMSFLTPPCGGSPPILLPVRIPRQIFTHEQPWIWPDPLPSTLRQKTAPLVRRRSVHATCKMIPEEKIDNIDHGVHACA